MRHLSLSQLSARVDDALSGVSLELVDRHLAGCEECRTRVSRIQRVDGVLVQLIRSEPGEHWMRRTEQVIAARLGEETGLAFGVPPAPRATPAASPAPSPAAPRPAAQAPRAEPARPPAATPAEPATPAVAAPPGPSAPAMLTPRPVGEAPRWSVHADRLARVRRQASDRPREAALPLIAGLLGGAAAGALIVTLVFGTRPPSPSRRAASPPGASATVAARPVAPPETAALAPSESEAPKVEPAETSLPHPPVTPPAVEPVTPAAPEGAKPAEKIRAPRSEEAARPAVPSPKPLEAVKPHPVPRPPLRTAPVREAPARARAPQPDAQDGDWPMLCGLVVDDTGAPVSGARVLLADLDLGVRSDRRGRFCISGPAGVRTMSVVALGFVTHREIVTISDPSPELRIVLASGR